MCGIAGFVGSGDKGVLARMLDRIRHRGPDAEGILCREASGVHLGHRRLTILDAEGGGQPMSTADGRLHIVFNGEIYNFVELRRELEAEGVRFQSHHSDTEVVLLGYRQWGEAVLERLNGMWAFVIFDEMQGRLFLARDRFGKKPLYFSQLSGVFIFASELSALREHPAAPSSPDPLALKKYFAYGYVPAPRTLLAGVSKVRAGCYVRVDVSSLAWSEHRYWEYRPEPDEGLLRQDPEDLAGHLLALLDRAVQRRMMADVPVGTFLSGGIDSSLITALAAKHVDGANPLQAFSIGFREVAFDESVHARSVAEALGVSHHLDFVTLDDARGVIPQLLRRLDEPFADSSVVPTYLLSRCAASRVKVALGGDGADELFAGYDPFRALAPAALYNRFVPRPVHDGVRALVNMLPVSHGYMSWDFRVKRTLGGLGYPAELWLPAWMAPVDARELGDLLCGPVSEEEIYSEAIDAWGGVADIDPVDRATCFFVKLYLQESILPKVDRASMLNSLEVRAPFLDIDVVNFARRLPASLKLRKGRSKWLLRRAAAKAIPAAIIERKKQGFALPIGKWLADGELDDLCGDSAFWSGKLEEHKLGRRDHRLALWANVTLNGSGLLAKVRSSEGL